MATTVRPTRSVSTYATTRGGPPPPLAEGQKPRPRFDPNPKAAGFLEEFPEQRFRSIFEQTEEGILAEHAERVEGAIETWKSKLVVDDPVLRVDMRTREKASQQDKITNLLQDKPLKRSLKSLYRGKHPMKRDPEMSAFMSEETLDLSLATRGHGMRGTWTTQKWPDPTPREASSTMSMSASRKKY